MIKAIWECLCRTEWFVPLTRNSKGSGAVFFARLLNNLFTLPCILTWIKVVFYTCQENDKKSEMPRWFSEIWVLFLSIILLYYLRYGHAGNIIILLVGLYVLVDVLGATFRDIVASPFYHKDEEGEYIYVRDKTRWLTLAVVNVAQIVLCFALLALFYGDQFEPQITNWFSAICFSVGYGNFEPICIRTQLLVCGELVVFLIIMVVKLPVAVSVIRVDDKSMKQKKENTSPTK